MSSMLFSPIRLGTMELPNRIVIPPMCQYSAEDGLAGDWHMMHYGNLSLSGAGLLIVEACAVTPEGRISPADIGIWSDTCAEALGRVLSSVRSYSSMPLCLQLAHAGRKASQPKPWQGDGVLSEQQGGWAPEAPSAVQYSHGDAGGVVPRAMSQADCERIRQAFVRGAERAMISGFTAVELHMAHGYLLHEFLSPLSNARTDSYGGCLENRLRYPLEVFEAVQAALPDGTPIGVRISASDWAEGGWDVEQSLALASALQERNCAYLHVSGGGLSEQQQIAPGPGYQVGMAASIRAHLGTLSTLAKPAMPVIAVGLITEAEQAESILRSKQADLVAVGRSMLFNPRWPWHAARKLGARVSVPPQYLRSAPYGAKGLFA